MTTPGRRRRRRAALVAGLLAASLLVPLQLAPMPAVAAENPPTVRELLDECGRNDYCVFHPEGEVEHYVEPLARAGQSANCTPRPQRMDVGWSTTSITGNSVGVSLEVTVGPASKIFMAGFKTAFGHDWISTSTDTDVIAMEVPARSVGYVNHAMPMQKVHGKWELHFSDKFHGHYYWYVNDFTQWGPDTSSAARGATLTGSSAMSPSTYRALCRPLSRS